MSGSKLASAISKKSRCLRVAVNYEHPYVKKAQNIQVFEDTVNAANEHNPGEILRGMRRSFATHMEEVRGKVSEEMHRELSGAFDDLANGIEALLTTPPAGDTGAHVIKLHADFLEKTVDIRHRYWVGSDVPTMEALREDVRDLVETPMIVDGRMGSA